MSRGTCAVVGCEREVETYRWCHGHYEFWRRTKTEPTKPFLDTPEKRFWAKVDKNGPVPSTRPDLGQCWLWTASTDGLGRYGSIHWDGKLRRAHHVAHLLLVGPLVPGKEWDHLCRVTLCVRPSHGEWTTHTENLLRGVGFGAMNARKTHCLRGHEFTPENTRLRGGRYRVCLACVADRRSVRAAQQRERRARLSEDELRVRRARAAANARRRRRERSAA